MARYAVFLQARLEPQVPQMLREPHSRREEVDLLLKARWQDKPISRRLGHSRAQALAAAVVGFPTPRPLFMAQEQALAGLEMMEQCLAEAHTGDLL